MAKALKMLYDPSRVKELRLSAQCSIAQVSKATGIVPSNITMYEQDEIPSIEDAAILAKFYRVPMEYLLNLADIDETSFDMIPGFRETKRLSYETWLRCGKKADANPSDKSIIAPWPYNLYQVVIGCTGDILNVDQMDGLYEALGTLPEKRRAIILGVYRDGKSQTSLAKEMNISVSLVGQNLDKGLRTLRHPANAKLFKWGFWKTKELDKLYADKAEELRRRENEINRMRDLIAKALFILCERSEETKMTVYGKKPTKALLEMAISALVLSTHAYSVLMRNNISTIGELCKKAKNRELAGLKQLGSKTLYEILTALYCYTGVDYFKYYDITPPDDCE